jgi:hypothetical protein
MQQWKGFGRLWDQTVNIYSMIHAIRLCFWYNLAQSGSPQAGHGWRVVGSVHRGTVAVAGNGVIVALSKRT